MSHLERNRAVLTLAVRRSPVLQHPFDRRSSEAFLRKAACVSCHNNALAPLTMAAVRKSKLPVNERIARSQVQQVAAFMASNVERALQGLGVPGGIDTVGYVLMGMAAQNYPPDVTTDTWARFLKTAQDGRLGVPRRELDSAEPQVHWRVGN